MPNQKAAAATPKRLEKAITEALSRQIEGYQKEKVEFGEITDDELDALADEAVAMVMKELSRRAPSYHEREVERIARALNDRYISEAREAILDQARG